MKADNRFRLINGSGLPEGWLGKIMHVIRLALQANGNYLLFLDADVRVEKSLVGSLGTCSIRNFSTIVFPIPG